MVAWVAMTRQLLAEANSHPPRIILAAKPKSLWMVGVAAASVPLGMAHSIWEALSFFQ